MFPQCLTHTRTHSLAPGGYHCQDDDFISNADGDVCPCLIFLFSYQSSLRGCLRAERRDDRRGAVGAGEVTGVVVAALSSVPASALFLVEVVVRAEKPKRSKNNKTETYTHKKKKIEERQHERFTHSHKQGSCSDRKHSQQSSNDNDRQAPSHMVLSAYRSLVIGIVFLLLLVSPRTTTTAVICKSAEKSMVLVKRIQVKQ